jgi:IclR family KDG regulon transcriptional repressor
MAEQSKTTDHALRVLLHLSDHGPMTAAELTRSLEMNRTVVHRLLTTLHKRGFVTKQANGYAPGVTLMRIAEQAQPELRAAAQAVLGELVSAVGETLVLHVQDANDAVVIDQAVAGGHVLRVEHRIGSRHRMDTGASGRALLAFLSPHSIERVLGHAEDEALLRAELEAVRARGYATSHDELQQGVHGMAVPVMDKPGHAIASLAMIVPTTREVALQDNLDALIAGAERIALSLTGTFVRAQGNATRATR